MKRLLGTIVAALAFGTIATAASAQLGNGDFEGPGYTPWVRPFLAGAGTARFDQYNATPFGPASPRSPNRMVGAAASYSVGKDLAYMYQQVNVLAGQIELRAWGNSWNWHQGAPGGATDTQIRFGLDLNGGIDPNAAGIIWSSPVNAISGDFFSSPWQERVINATKTSDGMVTVFARVRHKFALEWNVTYVDDFTMTVVPEPSSMLAMGTGIIGMAGMMLRRRK